ncbi:MAG TPA: hypothetical protein VHQ20_01610 [Patescibacteria group bacterium]|jgi:hypothetical protein|nr:hypothetical protein [Patescibacteria group bacterium]
MNLKDFLQLAGQQGKVVVIGEDGNVKGVFLNFDEYQKLAGNKSVEQTKEDLTERVNREILLAQLEEVISSTNGGLAAALPHEDVEMEVQEELQFEPVERIDSVLSKRAQDLFKSIPVDDAPLAGPLISPYRDYRTPDVASSSDEEIKPNFDDI